MGRGDIMDTYQAVYDAVRSRIGSVNIDGVARQALDISFAVEQVRSDISYHLSCAARPSVLFRPRLFLDGSQYCALYGEDIMAGCAGFGDTASDAMANFDKNWNEQKLKEQPR